ncbi:hypothetical protein P4161_04640 [Pseudomonas aeruginosa]|nr:hypothetical protein [Pseudomonas aeruginosa]
MDQLAGRPGASERGQLGQDVALFADQRDQARLRPALIFPGERM